MTRSFASRFVAVFAAVAVVVVVVVFEQHIKMNLMDINMLTDGPVLNIPVTPFENDVRLLYSFQNEV